jgi:hypothetical protein
MRQLQLTENLPKKATASVAEKWIEIKLRVEGPLEETFSLLEELEILELGIEGKNLCGRHYSRQPERKIYCNH